MPPCKGTNLIGLHDTEDRLALIYLQSVKKFDIPRVSESLITKNGRGLEFVQTLDYSYREKMINWHMVCETRKC